jgi:hypothetical protein
LNILLYLLLSIPAVQEKTVALVLAELKPRINTEARIGSVRISLFNRVNLRGLYVEDQQQDTLLYVKELNASINLWKIFGNTLQLDAVSLDGAVVNISRAMPDAPFNFEFLIEAFAGSGTQSEPASEPMRFRLQNIVLAHSRATYRILSVPPTPDMFNTSRLSAQELNMQLDFNFTGPGDWTAEIASLSLKEQSGIIIKKLAAKAEAKAYCINGGNIRLQLPNSDLELKDVAFSLLDSKFGANLAANIQPADLSALLPDMKELKHKIVLNGRISGDLPSVAVENLSLDYGQVLNLQAAASMDNVREYGNSRFNLHIDQLTVMPEAIEQLARLGNADYANPAPLNATGALHLQAAVEGSLTDMDIRADAWAKQGAIRLTGKAATDPLFDDFRVKTTLFTQNFDLTGLAGEESGLKKISLHLNIDASSIKKMNAQFSGAIDRLQYKNDELKDVRFDGKYSAALADLWLDADLPVGKIAAKTRCLFPAKASEPQRIDFDVDVHHFPVDYFLTGAATQNIRLTACIAGSFAGLNLNNLQGRAVIDSLSLQNGSSSYESGKITLEASQKHLSLNSSFVAADLSGDYNFATLVPEMSNLLHSYLPCLFTQNRQTRKPQNNFDITVAVGNSDSLSKIIPLPLDILTPLTVKGRLNAVENTFKLESDIPAVRIGRQEIRNASFDIGNQQSESTALRAQAELLQAEGRLNLNLTADAAADSVETVLSVENKQSLIDLNGQLKARAYFENAGQETETLVHVLPSDLRVGALKFGILPAIITYRNERTAISGGGISLAGRKYIGLDGVVSASPNDSLRLYFDRAQLGDVLTAFDINNIHAQANGELVATSLRGAPHVHAKNFRLNDIVVFGDTLGALDMQGGWNDAHQLFDFNASLKSRVSTSLIAGKYAASTDSLDLSIALEKLPLNWLQPFMSGTLHKLTGSVSSNIAVSGKPSSPATRGWLGFNDMRIGVDYTNVTYHISDTIKIFTDRIGFRDLTITDQNKNEAVASALISHHNFKDFSYLLNLDLKNFMILNTEDRTDSLFYGRLFVSGNVKANGKGDNITLDMDVRGDKNSVINITLPDVSEAADYRSIVYINVPQDLTNKTEQAPEQRPLPLKLGMNLELTPNVGLNVLLNPLTGDAMQIKGAGKVKFDYDLAADNMTTYGDYVLSDGSVKLKFQNLANLEFRIREGSKLNFTGDPMRASFDITAYKRVRTSLQNLDESFASASKVNVDCILGIKGSIQKMDLTYDISLPDADDDVRSKLKSLINTDDEKVKNFASLVATGTFYTQNNANANFEENMLTSVASGALSGILNATFRNILGDSWEINADIASQDGTFSDVGVNVSTRLFDDRLKLNTNLGYRTEQATSENAFIGDFDLTYALTKLWQLKVYNKTNDRFYKQAASTQGVGIVYTKEAATLRQLFRSFGRRKDTEEYKNGTRK